MQAYKKKGFWVGIALFLMTVILPSPESLSQTGWYVAGIGLLMATWWATEAVPVPVTALLPLALFPIFGVLKPALCLMLTPISISLWVVLSLL
jgi:sodium-dependent dicarboxylate transporter 2/3/5